MLRTDKENKQKPKNLFKFATESLASGKFQPGAFTRKQHTPEHVISKNNIKVKPIYEENSVETHYYKQSQHQSSIQSSKNQDKTNKLYTHFEQKLKNIDSTFKQALEIAFKKLGDKLDKYKTQNSQGVEELVTKINKKLLKQDKAIQGVKEDVDILGSNMSLFKNYFEEQVLSIKSILEQLSIDTYQKKNSKNVPNHYSINLKNSIQQLEIIQENNRNQEIQTLKTQIQLVKSAINAYDHKLIDITSLKKQQNFNSQLQSTSNHQQLKQLNDKINHLTKQIQVNNRIIENKLNQQNCTVRITLNLFQQNINNINQQFKRVINNQISPKIDKISNQQKITNDNLIKYIKKYYQDVISEQSKKIHVIKVRSLTTKQSDKLKYLSGEISYKQTYLLDQQNYLLDSEGVYLVDQNKQKIKIAQDQIYFLQLNGIQIIEIS